MGARHRLRPAWRRRADVSGLWTPKKLGSALKLWLRADRGTYQDTAKTVPATSDGDVVGCWEDQSGNGYDLVQATTSYKPLLRIDGGMYVIESDSTDDILSSLVAITLQGSNYPVSIGLVHKYVGEQLGGIRYHIPSSITLLLVRHAYSQLDTLIYGDDGYVQARFPRAPTSYISQIWTYDGSELAAGVHCYNNGVEQTANDVIDSIGTTQTTTSDYRFSLEKGLKIAELIVTASELKPSQVQKLHNYFAKRYGL